MRILARIVKSKITNGNLEIYDVKMFSVSLKRVGQ